jgi:hypothetical protein
LAEINKGNLVNSCTLGAQTNSKGAKQEKEERRRYGPQSPIAKAQDLLGPFDLYTRASEILMSNFFPSNSFYFYVV